MSGFRPLIPQAVPLRATARGPLAVGRRVVGHPPLATRPWPSVRTEVVREFFLIEHGREPMDARELAGQIAKDLRPRAQTVAGYDLTFPPVKSVSTLWAVADLAGGCGDRTGPSGRGRGRFGAHRGSCVICTDTATKHPAGQRPGPGCRRVHPSRQAGGDPDLHTHVAVANKVQTSTDAGCLSMGVCCSRPVLPRRPTTTRSNSISATR
jgi:hypothetical protein